MRAAGLQGVSMTLLVLSAWAAVIIAAFPRAAAADPESVSGGGDLVISCAAFLQAGGKAETDSTAFKAPGEERTIPDELLEGEPEEPPAATDEDLEIEGIKSFKLTQKYATRKLENVRTSVTIFNFMWIEMKGGSAGWAQYDDLFASGAVWTKLTLGDFKLPIPIGGFELSYIGMPFYQILLGGFYELYTGRHKFGNEFSDMLISSVYFGMRVNLFNEYTALMQWEEMFNFSRPKHFLGINIYLKCAVFLAIWNRVTYTGAYATGNRDTYFNQTETFGYFLLAGFEYRFATMGLFFEAGWKYTKKPDVARPLVKVNHFRSFPVTFGLTIYFSG